MVVKAEINTWKYCFEFQMNLNHFNIPILLYHCIVPLREYQEMRSGSKKIYSISHDRFTEQIDYLSQRGYNSITLDNLVGYADKKISLPLKPIVITFDDGSLSDYTLAYPILKKVGFTAIFFVTTDWIGQPDRLTWEHIREMSRGGMGFGSHGTTHKCLSKSDPREITLELKESKRVLEKKLGRQINYLSIPGGHYSKKIKKIAKRTGYVAVCTSKWGIYKENSDLFSLRRLGVKNNIPLEHFTKLIDMDSGTIQKEQFKSFIKNSAKKIIGISRYDRIKENLLKDKGR